jgi:acylphosphatase
MQLVLDERKNSSMKQSHVFISGLVQGVGFRSYVRSKARKIGVYGWVRNLSDGRVEALFQGEAKKIQLLITLCNRGPFLAKVEHVVVEHEDMKEKYTAFQQLPTL